MELLPCPVHRNRELRNTSISLSPAILNKTMYSCRTYNKGNRGSSFCWNSKRGPKRGENLPPRNLWTGAWRGGGSGVSSSRKVFSSCADHFAVLTLNRIRGSLSMLTELWISSPVAHGITWWPPFLLSQLQVETGLVGDFLPF